jgi:hypothetical protein
MSTVTEYKRIDCNYEIEVYWFVGKNTKLEKQKQCPI